MHNAQYMHARTCHAEMAVFHVLVTFCPAAIFDRIADNVMKMAQEDELQSCVSGNCVKMLGDANSADGSNCSTSCVVLVECVAESMLNVSKLRLGHHLYNKSLAIESRRRCLALEDAPLCVNILALPEGETRSRRHPKQSGCINFDCFYCLPQLYKKYFECALECGKVHSAQREVRSTPRVAMPSDFSHRQRMKRR